MQSEIKKIENAVHHYFKPITEFTLLFGSIVTNRFNENSDVDCAVFFKKKQTFEKMVMMIGDLTSSTHRKIDLVNLNTADIIITMQALANGKLLYSKDNNFFYKYKAQKITEYIDFKQNRKIIEDALLEKTV